MPFLNKALSQEIMTRTGVLNNFAKDRNYSKEIIQNNANIAYHYCTKIFKFSNFKNFYVGRYSLKSQAEMLQESGIKDVQLLRYSTSKFLEITELNHKNQQGKYYFQNCPKQNISIIFVMLYEPTIFNNRISFID